MTNNTLWGIHPRTAADAHSLFMSQNVVALDCPEVGDLTKISPERKHYKQAVVKAFPGKKPAAVPGMAGQLFRFACQMQTGDYLVYPSKFDRQIHMAKVEGDYRYDPQTSPACPHLRAVTWLKSFPRDAFSKAALYEIGSASIFVQVKTYAGEFFTALEGGSPAEPSLEEESPVKVDLEEAAHDEISALIISKLKGHGLPRLVEAILRAEGYTTYRSPEGPDGGVDILAGAGPMGFGSPRLCVQVKSQNVPVGRQEIDQLMGATKKFKTEEALFVSWSGFKQNVYKEVSPNFFSLRLWTQKELLEKLFLYYEVLDEDIKAEIPLKQMWTIAAPGEG